MQIPTKNGKAVWQQGWAEVGGQRCYFRSRWEYRYALYLQLQLKYGYIVKWEHEPHTFYFDGIKRGTNNYKPDFRVTFPDGREEWYEVKGYMDKKSLTKIQRMKKYHPHIKLTVVDELWFITAAPALKKVLPNW